MSNSIHPTAIIENGAQIGANVTVGAFCFIGPKVTIQDNVTLKSHVNIEGVTQIGQGSVIYPFASLGTAPQDLKYAGEETQLLIGQNNTIREHVTMNTGTLQDQGKTIVGDNGLFMTACHVAHDCVIGDGVIMANNATLGGHVHIGDYAVLGGLCAVHQFIRIGAYAVIGGMSGVESDVIPFGRVKGERAHLAGLNLVGLERGGFDKNAVKDLTRAYKSLFDGEGLMDDRIEALADEFKGHDLIEGLITFARGKNRFPLCQPKKKAA